MTIDSTAAPTRSIEHRTVSRVMAILELVIAKEPNGLRLADLAEAVEAPKSSIHGLARGLVATGYLREEQGRYMQGSAVSALLGIGEQHVPAAFHHALEKLSARWNETAVLATIAGDSVVNLDAVEPNQMIRASPPLHERRPMWPGSYGKIFLAYMEPSRLNAYLGRNHKEPSERAGILNELDEIRSRGVAFNRGLTDPDLFGVAAPVMVAGTATVTLALGVAGPLSRIPSDLDALVRDVQAVASGLSFPGGHQS